MLLPICLNLQAFINFQPLQGRNYGSASQFVLPSNDTKVTFPIDLYFSLEICFGWSSELLQMLRTQVAKAYRSLIFLIYVPPPEYSLPTNKLNLALSERSKSIYNYTDEDSLQVGGIFI